MAVFLAFVIALTVVTSGAVFMAWRRRHLSTPAARYQRDVHGIRLGSVRRTEHRYTRQRGRPEGSGWTGF